MDMFTSFFPPAFPALALSHFVALLSPGPDFFLLMGYAIRYRLRGSVGLCVGIAAGNGLYIVLAIIGWGVLRQAPLLFTVVELLGAAYLLWIGSLLLQSRPRRWLPTAPRLHARRWQNSFCWGWVLRCSIPKTPCFIWR
jgi:threonine/homoserine/homoserine lactone efflux protein